MNPIFKIKEEEKKEGKPNPIFDGFVEPDFPKYIENIKTLEGVDSNHDGVRDDVEIWINRTSEDESIRLGLKDFYKTFFEVLESIENKKTESVVHNKADMVIQLMECLDFLYYPYDSTYLKKYKMEGARFATYEMEILFNDSELRKKIWNKYNFYGFKGSFTSDSMITCSSRSFGKTYKERVDLARAKAKEKEFLQKTK
jgi:hypothetical protein